MKNFRTYQLALELAKLSRDIRLKGPYQNQYQRAVLSIALNLSEGSSKESKKERRRHYEIAFGSAREAQTIIKVLDLKALSPQIDKLCAHLYCLVRSLRL